MINFRQKEYSSYRNTSLVSGVLGAGLGYKLGGVKGSAIGSALGAGLVFLDKRKKKKEEIIKANQEKTKLNNNLYYSKLLNTWKSKVPNIYKELSQKVKDNKEFDLTTLTTPERLSDALIGMDYTKENIIPLALGANTFDGGTYLVYDYKSKKYGYINCGEDPEFPQGYTPEKYLKELKSLYS